MLRKPIRGDSPPSSSSSSKSSESSTLSSTASPSAASSNPASSNSGGSKSRPSPNSSPAASSAAGCSSPGSEKRGSAASAPSRSLPRPRRRRRRRPRRSSFSAGAASPDGAAASPEKSSPKSSERLVHYVQRPLRLERPRLDGRGVEVVPGGQLGFDFRGHFGRRHAAPLSLRQPGGGRRRLCLYRIFGRRWLGRLRRQFNSQVAGQCVPRRWPGGTLLRRTGLAAGFKTGGGGADGIVTGPSADGSSVEDGAGFGSSGGSSAPRSPASAAQWSVEFESVIGFTNPRVES